MGQVVRLYLRLVIETLLILVVYLSWLISIGFLGEINAATHSFNALLWFSAYKALGLTTDRLRFSSLASLIPLAKISTFLSLLLLIEIFATTGTIEIIYCFCLGLLSFNILVGFRITVRQLIRRDASKARENVIIYGTSDLAIDLFNAMAFGKKYNVVAFISEAPRNVRFIAGLPVITLEQVESVASTKQCKLVVLASQSVSTEQQSNILLRLDKLGLSVSSTPTIDRAFDYEVQLKAVNPEDVLGRASEVNLDASVKSELNEKTVFVTGAGGSIGSEICRQILRYQPKKLLILELNEFALYSLQQEISSVLGEIENKIQVNYYLGSVSDEFTLNRIFEEHKVDIVYHAAAYKHVPIVEGNILAGVKNNVLGTNCVADFAHRFGVDKFVLVSSDKAVRPTNIMGASKRLAELVVHYRSKSSNTTFTSVRFGNVLGSSGSVIPKFKSQINAGGPITVTHEEITRYFMSIPEAAHLVLSAGSMSTSSDVFLLDMGEPVKILNLAKSMVRQHGLQPVLPSEIANRAKKQNEILIEFCGLRPGEKLYEELLVDGVAQETPNPRIFKSYDVELEEIDLKKVLQGLQKNINEGNSQAVIQQLKELPLGYQPHTASDTGSIRQVRVDLEQTIKSKTSVGDDASVNFAIHKERTSLLEIIFSSKLGLAVLHRYFLLVRGMTLGVRILVQNSQGEILLVQHSYLPGWHLPGGGVDHYEDVETAARRELYEETGISEITNLQFCGVLHNRAISDRDHVVYFKAQTSQDISIKPNFEISNVRFVSRDIASEILSPEHLKYALEFS